LYVKRYLAAKWEMLNDDCGKNIKDRRKGGHYALKACIPESKADVTLTGRS
jgi:hypothetical protein